MENTERLDCLPDGTTRIWQDSREFCFTTDAVFLAAFPHLVRKAKALDLVAANPPYRIGGRRRQVGQAACHETGTTLEDFFAAAAWSLKTRGRFALVQLPERFTDAVKLGIRYQLELKRLQWVHAYVDRPAWIFLAEFVKGGKPGLEVLPPLCMYDPDGSYSRETLAYYALKGDETHGK